jgi:predicted heme/steroid binding protein
MALKEYTRTELSRYDGRNGAPAYIAYKGLIYNVSGSYHWRNGEHWVLHSAGRDLTAEMHDAPHDTDLLEAFPVIGMLSEK